MPFSLFLLMLFSYVSKCLQTTTGQEKCLYCDRQNKTWYTAYLTHLRIMVQHIIADYFSGLYPVLQAVSGLHFF